MGRSDFEIVALTKFVVGFLPMTLLSIFPEDCICTSLCGALFGTLTMRNSKSFRHVLVVNTSAWKNKI